MNLVNMSTYQVTKVAFLFNVYKKIFADKTL